MDEAATIARRLAGMLTSQIQGQPFAVRTHAGMPGAAPEPAVCVLLDEQGASAAGPDQAAAGDSAPAALVVEVWSPEPGACNLRAGLRSYQERGDAEIWFLHPRLRRLTAWRRDVDGTYARANWSSGVVEPVRLPGVVISVEHLFAGVPNHSESKRTGHE